MTTKYNFLSYKDKQNVFVDTTDNNQYKNLNLNQNQKYVYKSFRLNGVTIDNKKVQHYALSNLSDFPTDNVLKSKKDLNLWKKSNEYSTFLNFNHDSEEKNEFKENSSSANNSTLSLHIAAYENSIENSAENELNGCEKKSSLIKKWGLSNHITDNSISIKQNPFEFPRQQDDQDNRPEVMQFVASQRVLNPNYFVGEIEEIPANVCGQIADRYIIEAPIDDIVKRDISMYYIYDINQPELNLFLVIPRNDIKQNRRNTSVHRMLRVLQITRNRSVHFPRLILSGHLQKLVYGLDGEQAFERDPEWPDRPMAIIESDNTILGSLPCFSNNGALPAETALQLGIGIFRAIAALHRAGFVHRLISPYSFTIATPLSADIIQRGVTIIDFSFVIPFPIQPRAHVPFVGTMRYSSIRAHFGREQGPSDDVISLIYVIAEFISGKLPWRSVHDEQTVVNLKRDFCQSDCFRRLPREIRRLYRDMYLTPGPSTIDHNIILGDLITALSRKNPDPQNKLPTFLNTETPKIFPRRKRDRRRMTKNIETGAAAAATAAGGNGGAGGGGGDAKPKSRITTTF